MTVSAKLASLLPSLPPSSVFSDLSFSSWQDVQVHVVLHQSPAKVHKVLEVQTLHRPYPPIFPMQCLSLLFVPAFEILKRHRWENSEDIPEQHNYHIHLKLPKNQDFISSRACGIQLAISPASSCSCLAKASNLKRNRFCNVNEQFCIRCGIFYEYCVNALLLLLATKPKQVPNKTGKHQATRKPKMMSSSSERNTRF